MKQLKGKEVSPHILEAGTMKCLVFLHENDLNDDRQFPINQLLGSSSFKVTSN